MPLSPDLYDRDYFLSDRCEGYEHFRDGRLSAVKRYELEQLRVEPGMDILDAGCGRGEVLKACAEVGATVAGIDYSEAAVALTRETLAGVDEAEVRAGDVTALPWPDDRFDRVLFADVIEHLDPDQAAAALGEFRRVLKPGGMVLVHTAPNRLFRRAAWPALRPFVRVAARETAARLDDYLTDVRTYHVFEQTPRGLRRLVAGAGFAAVEGWVHPDVLRSGSHRLTEGLTERRLFTIGSRVAGAWPLRLLLGNDLYARGFKR